MTEDEAVLSCQKGDKDAFRYLVELHKDVVYGTAYLMTGNRSLAEEQMQEAFLAAWRGIQGFQAGRPFKPWLVRILVNGVLTQKRKRTLSTVPLDDLEPSSQWTDPAEEVEALQRRIAGTGSAVGTEPRTPPGGYPALLRRIDGARSGAGYREARGHGQVQNPPGAGPFAGATGRAHSGGG